jgi:glycosyltransferase involved in cell wall biosynthesis
VSVWVVTRSAKARIKYAIFERLPAMSIAEAIESRLRVRALSRIRAHEDSEVRHALSSLGGPVHARIVTVIATYRRPQLLQRAIESALAQPIEGHAVLVVDDGGGEVPPVTDPRVHVINLTSNIGICGVVRNVGIRSSESSYLAFLDDDNRWEPDHLPRALDALSDQSVFSYSGVRVLTPSGALVHESCVPFARRALRHTNFVDASSIVAPRSEDVIFSRLPRSRGTARHEDWEFAYRLSALGPVTHVPVITVEYLDNPNSHYRNVSVG